MGKPRDAYLKPNRLEDVIFLIQYLGLGKAYGLEDGTEADGIIPRSVCNKKWSDIAEDHSEFFRLTDKKTCTLALRYYLRNGGTPPLKIELVQELIKTAMTLHERQAKRVEVWRGRITLIAAVVGAVTGVVGLLWHR
jgi:hypothetical protein